MDDLSVFRRFFVISGLISELMQSFTGAMMGGEAASESDYADNNTVRRTKVEKYGEDPFAPPVESSMPDMNEQINDSHGFPS